MVVFCWWKTCLVIGDLFLRRTCTQTWGQGQMSQNPPFLTTKLEPSVFWNSSTFNGNPKYEVTKSYGACVCRKSLKNVKSRGRQWVKRTWKKFKATLEISDIAPLTSEQLYPVDNLYSTDKSYPNYLTAICPLDRDLFQQPKSAAWLPRSLPSTNSCLLSVKDGVTKSCLSSFMYTKRSALITYGLPVLTLSSRIGCKRLVSCRGEIFTGWRTWEWCTRVLPRSLSPAIEAC